MQGPSIPDLGSTSAVLNLNSSLNLFVSQNIISQEQPNASFLNVGDSVCPCVLNLVQWKRC
jgi:hypothetical protein